MIHLDQPSRLRVKISWRTRQRNRNSGTTSLPVGPRTATTRGAPVRVAIWNTCVQNISGNPIHLQYTLSACKLANVSILAGSVFHTRVTKHVSCKEWMHANISCCVSIRKIDTPFTKFVILPMTATIPSLTEMGLQRIQRAAMWKTGS